MKKYDNNYVSHTPLVQKTFMESIKERLSYISNSCLRLFNSNNQNQIFQRIDIGPNVSNKKTLVLDLDETLIFSTFFEYSEPKHDFEICLEVGGKICKNFVQKRPFLDEFMNSISEMYDVVIFTASTRNYCKAITDIIAPNIPDQKILSREHCTIYNGLYVKKISNINRDIKDIVIIDNNYLSFILDPENGYECPSYNGQKNDRFLIDTLLPMLIKINNYDDVRVALKEL